MLGGRCVSARALKGGITSAMHVLTLESPAGVRRRVVLRRYVRPELVAEEPDNAAREARTLRFVESLAIPPPRLLGVDPTGEGVAVPSVVMSRIGGKVDWWPADMDRWLRGLAELLPAIHEARPPEDGTVPEFVPYAPEHCVPPSWATDTMAWERAFEIFQALPPSGERVFVHRDFHPGNVLWSRGSVSGLVDWQAACIGPPTVDVGHCRANLYRYGLGIADQFRSLWESISGRQYDPWTEVVSIIGVMDAFGTSPGNERAEMERALTRAVSDIG
jgi:aminoglycoside phosphotransferase (APT) family kinase protein